MKVLWKLPEASVAQVRAALGRPLAYTTVMTVLDRMAAKGLVARRKLGRAYVYSALLDRESARAAAVRRLLANLFDNDRQALAHYVAGLEQVDSPSTPARTGRPAARAAAAAKRSEAAFHPSIDDTLL